VPRAAQTAAETLAQKAIAAGIPGEQVDGNDVIAVRMIMERALARARAGDGASLVEAVTYRLGDHTTADDAGRYRDDETVSAQWHEEPILRLRDYLVNAKLWSKDDEEALIAETAAQVDAAVESYLATQPLPPEAMFDHLYEALPPSLATQRAAVAGQGEDGDG
jgi:pyruvate dehydrogenase E1 component alpha subunit